MYSKAKTQSQQPEEREDNSTTTETTTHGSIISTEKVRPQSEPSSEGDLLGDFDKPNIVESLASMEKPVVMRKKSTRRESITVNAAPLIIDDELMEPVTRGESNNLMTHNCLSRYVIICFSCDYEDICDHEDVS